MHTDGDSGGYIAEVVVYPEQKDEVLTFYEFRESPDSRNYLVFNYEGHSLFWTSPTDGIDEPAKYYLTIGSEGVKSIELSMPNSSGGFENADGSLLKKGERIWLENLDGYSDLCGLTITALGENGEIIWTASIPDGEENKGFIYLVNDDWKITNIE